MPTIADCLDQFLGDMEHKARLSRNTIAAYRYDLSLAARHLPQLLDQFTPNDLESFIHTARSSEERSTITPATAARRAATLRRFFSWARRQELCTGNPMELIDEIKLKPRRPRPIRKDTDRSAIDTAISTAPKPYRLIFTILRETGMRARSALTLQIGDVTLEAGREALRIREAESKNGVEQLVILTPSSTPKTIRRLRAHLNELGKLPQHTPVFSSNRGTVISYAALRYQWEQLCERAGLVDADKKPLYTLHQLRHTRGTELLEQGQRLETVQRILGHRSIKSTQVYAELNDDQVRAELERHR